MTRGGSFYDNYPVTAVLLAVIAGFFVLEMVAQRKLDIDPDAVSMFSVHPTVARVLGSSHSYLVQHRHEVWRLLSCVFLHGSLLHLLCNAYMLFYLGSLCESRLSSPKFFTSFILCGLGGSSLGFAAAVLFGGVSNSVGASGGLFGLFGLLLTYSIRERDWVLRDSLVQGLIFIAVLSFLIPGIDHLGHLGGFLTGCLIGFSVKEYTTSRTAKRWIIPAYVTGAAVTLSLGWAVWNYFSVLREQ